MSKSVETVVREACRKVDNDRTRMMDVVRELQSTLGCVSGEAMDVIADAMHVKRVEVEGVVSFYAFLSKDKKGKIVIRLCDDVIDAIKGFAHAAAAFKEELRIDFGETTPDGLITLERCAFIGMGDQAPAALVNDTVLTNLTADKARDVVRALRETGDPAALVTTLGDGNNAHPLVQAMVQNNIRQTGAVVFAPQEAGVALKKALAMSPAEVIRDIKTSRLRGRGGAGFPTGMKWDFTRQAQGDARYVVCNADEGEPGTFKDRVILTECADLMFEGMTIAGYAIGASRGILYLRAEYAYLRAFLEKVLADRRAAGLLGAGAGGKDGFDFDIRIQMGAGAYICGEETSLLNSCEGQRGDPRTRPPFPAQKGFHSLPTTVNNVETFCCVARILDKGPGWFAQMGSKGSSGTKVLSVSGDCKRPGVYEVPFGITVTALLKLAGAENAAAVQVGGASGKMIGPDAYARTICYDDLATGGSIMVFGPHRSILDIVDSFMEFFVEESCGFCTPCRVGNVLLRNKLKAFRDGKAGVDDIAYLEALGKTVKLASRCGLGQTSPNPILSTLESFRPLYEAGIGGECDGLKAEFDIMGALSDASAIAGRPSEVYA
jgi:[NiFe] hydrogenase diaphorase moiety large subunit